MAKQPRAIMGSKADMISTRYDMVARNEIWRTVVRREREGLAASAAFPAERVAYLMKPFSRPMVAREAKSPAAESAMAAATEQPPKILPDPAADTSPPAARPPSGASPADDAASPQQQLLPAVFVSLPACGAPSARAATPSPSLPAPAASAAAAAGLPSRPARTAAKTPTPPPRTPLLSEARAAFARAEGTPRPTPPLRPASCMGQLRGGNAFGGMSETRASFQGSPISDAQRAVPVYPEDHLRPSTGAHVALTTEARERYSPRLSRSPLAGRVAGAEVLTLEGHDDDARLLLAVSPIRPRHNLAVPAGELFDATSETTGSFTSRVAAVEIPRPVKHADHLFLCAALRSTLLVNDSEPTSCGGARSPVGARFDVIPEAREAFSPRRPEASEPAGARSPRAATAQSPRKQRGTPTRPRDTLAVSSEPLASVTEAASKFTAHAVEVSQPFPPMPHLSIAGGRLLVPSRVCRRNSVWACCCCRAVHTTADGRTQAGAPVLIDRPVQVQPLDTLRPSDAAFVAASEATARFTGPPATREVASPIRKPDNIRPAGGPLASDTEYRATHSPRHVSPRRMFTELCDEVAAGAPLARSLPLSITGLGLERPKVFDTSAE